MKKRHKKKKRSRSQSHRLLASMLEKSGFSISPKVLSVRIFQVTTGLNLLFSLIFIYYASIVNPELFLFMSTFMIVQWTVGFVALLMIIWLLTLVVVDLRIYKRKVDVENVLSDFLQLTSANIRAGMAIDQALWHAIRPNFGVLAKEMEDVAKQTMSGTPLIDALATFSEKYDSKMLKQSMSLLIEGLNAGGEIGDLLDRISSNIRESNTMQREMSASVTTYAIFIAFACMVAAPFLLALSGQMLLIIEKIIGSIDVPDTGSSFAISFGQVGVSPADFRIFAIVTLALSSFISSCIVATIKKGNIKAGLRYIPIFMVVSIVLFLLLDVALGGAFSGIF